MSAIVEVAGVTMIAATPGVASGDVLPHDQLESATTMVVANVRPLLDMSPLRETQKPGTFYRRCRASQQAATGLTLYSPPPDPNSIDSIGNAGRGSITSR